MARRRRKATAPEAPDETMEDLSRADERAVEEIEQREEAAVTDDENPEERDPEELDRELGISRGPGAPVQSSAEVLAARDRRRT